METGLQELIQWTIENAFNVESQDGTNYTVIDLEEMRTKFDDWLEKEKEQKNSELSPVLYPQLKDIETAMLTIENGLLFSSLTPMLEKEKEKQLLLLIYEWKNNFVNNKI